MKKLLGNKVHWEKMRKPWKNSVIYCTKEMDGDWSKIYGNIPEANRYKPWEKRCMEAEYAEVRWRPWQQKVIDIVQGPIDRRRINWFWEPEGDSGKSFLTKWLFMNFRCIVGGGKKGDVFHQVAKAFEEDPEADPQLIILDIPRFSKDFVNYGAMEELKNGFVNSGKYEGGVFCFKCPHLVVFSNEPPDLTAMSGDRWHVRRLWKNRNVEEALVRPGESRNYIP